MAHQGFDLQLTRYDDRGWRRDVLHDWHGALADERDRHRMGTHAWHATQRAAWEALKKAETS